MTGSLRKYSTNSKGSGEGEMIRMTNQIILSKGNGQEVPLNNLLETSKNIYDSPTTFFKYTDLSAIPEFSLEDNLKSLQNDEEDNEGVHYEDWAFIVQPDKSLKKLYMVLIGKEIIAYSDQRKDDKVFFQNLSGCFIKDYSDSYLAKDKSKYQQFKIVVSKSLTRHFLTQTEDARTNWVDNLKKAIGYHSFLDYYTVQDDIDEGRFGKVKLGIHKSTGQKVAIKVIKKDELKETELELQKNELDLMKLFRHPNIVRLLDHFENDTYLYIVMEYLSGGNLKNYLHGKDNKLTEKEAGKIVYAVAQGIKYMNSYGIIHRDIKPENIMITDNSDNPGVKIIDFGLTKTLAPDERLFEGMGTITYVAPEVISRKPYNKEIDVWSLGVLLYHLLSGHLPFDDESYDEEAIGKKIVFLDHSFPHPEFTNRSKEAIRIIDSCLNKKPEKRITIEEFLKDDWVRVNYK
jgi:hypothetical protein